ncbi:hypothetical protein ACLB2K_050703 [Fragaria x ananassa]
MMASACFWDTSCNIFNFRFRQMGTALLDLYAIAGFPISDKPYQESDYQEEVVAFEADPDPNPQNFNDIGFELYAPNHFARRLGLQEELPFPLFENLNLYTFWHLKKNGKKQLDDPRFQTKLTILNVKIKSISLLFISKETSQTYEAWCSQEERKPAIIQRSEDEEVPLIGRRRWCAIPPNDGVTILDHDPEEEDKMTLNELHYTLLHVCIAALIAT